MTYRSYLFVGCVLYAGLCGASVIHAEQTQPNIIFVMLDDLGKEWVGCYGAQGIETPNIDKLAATGIKFNNAYSMPQCTPSRTCFLTGQYPFRNGWVNHWDVPRWGMGYFDWTQNPSIGRVMKAAGYKTAAAGKWQINDFRQHPDAMVKHGFDNYCMWTGYESKNPPSAKRYWDPYIHTKEGSRTYPGQFGPDVYNQFVLDFITANKDQPFFVYYPLALPHGPLVHTPLEPDVTETYDKYRAMVRYCDHLTGKLVNHLDKLGLRKKTIIVWTTDNGSSRGIYNEMNGRRVRGGKTQTTENGVNAPFIVNCPGTVPAGVVSDALIDFSDMLSTFADLAGASPEPGHVYDGFSAKKVFLGRAKTSPRKWNLAMGSHAGVSTNQGVENVYYFRDRVVREARYKLFVGIDRTPEKLVDVINDPAETKNLMDDPVYAAVVVRLFKAIDTMPSKDNDPQYTRDPDYPAYKRDGKRSQLHKIGHPDNLKGDHPPVKKMKKGR
ncbi:MAG: sulfatase-like hydrolase/transferase [Planctomycetes bacterium]|nr:sulfatase-like hydrolase/transferase [Planctomycetota bacterium]